MSTITHAPDAPTVMRVPVSGGKHYALVDAKDFDRVSQYSWSLARSGNRRTLYAHRRVGTTTEMMHNFILGESGIDHVNHNGLDNRRVNLRDGSGERNARNTRKTRSAVSSRFKGVCWRKPSVNHAGGWEANIRVDGKQKYLGKFKDEIEAAKAYDLAALRYYGEYASLNFPDDMRRVIGHRANGKPIFAMAGGSGEPEPKAGAPERPEGVSEEEWSALGDPGKAALVREREARQEVERQLAAARARPTPPANPPAQPSQQSQQQPGNQPPAQQQGGQPDIEAIVARAVEAAVKPFQEAEEQRQTQAAAQKVTDAVTTAAKDRLHDASDALSNIDLTKVVNDQGEADSEKVKAELDALVQRKPHLAKSGPRFAPPGIGGGAPATATDAEKVKDVLAQMQKATGIRLPAATTN